MKGHKQAQNIIRWVLIQHVRGQGEEIRLAGKGGAKFLSQPRSSVREKENKVK